VAYETARQVEHDCFLEDHQAAVRVADEYFARPGRNPYFAWWVGSRVLPSLLRQGRAADAAARYRATAREAFGVGYDWARSWRLEYLARVGDFARGLREFEAQLPAALAQPDPLSRYYCLRPAGLLLGRMAAGGVRTVALKAPPGVPWGKSRGPYEVSQVQDWVRAEAAAIATQFDRRNGNNYYSEWLITTTEQEGSGTS
jgi:hypothetical protein